MIYWLLLILLFICVNVNNNAVKPTLITKGKYNTLMVNRCVLIAVFVMALLVAFRGYDVGYDTSTYKIVYDGVTINGDSGFELFFDIIFKVFNGLGLPYYCVNIFVALLTFLILYFCFKDYCINPMLTIFLFIALGVYSSALSALRQMLATVILMFSLRFVLSGDFIKFCVCVLCAVFCHNSAIIFLPVFLFRYIKINKKLLILGLVLVIVAIVGFPIATKILSNFTAVNYYERYISTNVFANELSVFNLLYTLGIIGIFIICFALQKRVVKKFPEHKKMYDLFLLLFFTTAVIRAFAMFSGMPELMNRFTLFFFYSIAFLIPYIIKVFAKQNQQLLTNIIILFSLLFFYFLIFVKKSNGVAQYISIFGDNVFIVIVNVVLTLALGILMIYYSVQDNDVNFKLKREDKI